MPVAGVPSVNLPVSHDIDAAVLPTVRSDNPFAASAGPWLHPRVWYSWKDRESTTLSI